MRTPAIAVSTAGVAAAVLVLAALTGCGSKSPGGSSGLTDVNASASPGIGVPPSGSTPPVTTSGGPTTTATPTTATPTKTGSTKSTKVTYPKNQRDYATAALNAFVAGNQTLLRDFVLAGALSNFANLGHPNKHWHYYHCVSDGGNYACLFDNDNGDRLTIDVNPTYFGKPQAVNNASIDRTEFGHTPDVMVGAFMQAWFDGNTYRMKALSSGDTTSRLLGIFATPVSWMLSDDTTEQPGTTFVNVHLGSGGGTVSLQVKDSALGKAHGISIPDA